MDRAHLQEMYRLYFTQIREQRDTAPDLIDMDSAVDFGLWLHGRLPAGPVADDTGDHPPSGGSGGGGH